MRSGGCTILAMAVLAAGVCCVTGKDTSAMSREEETIAEKDLRISNLEFKLMERENLLDRYMKKMKRKTDDAEQFSEEIKRLEQIESDCKLQENKDRNKIGNLERSKDECQAGLEDCERRFNKAAVEVKDMYVSGRDRDRELERCIQARAELEKSGSKQPAGDIQTFKQQLLALKDEMRKDLPMASDSELYMDLLYQKYGECWLERAVAGEGLASGERQEDPSEDLISCQRHAGTVRTNFEGCLQQVESLSEERTRLAKQVDSLKADLKSCRGSDAESRKAATRSEKDASESSDDKCSDGLKRCNRKLKESEESAAALQEKLTMCKRQKQGLKIMKWYLRKRSVQYQERSKKLITENEEARAAVEKEQKKAKQAGKETDKLGKELVRLQKTYAEVSTELEQLTSTERACDAEKEHYKMLKGGMDVLLERTEKEEKQCKGVKAAMEVNLEEAEKVAAQFRLNFSLTLITLIILATINAYVYGSERYAIYMENQRLERAAERRERKEAKNRGRKVKSQ